MQLLKLISTGSYRSLRARGPIAAGTRLFRLAGRIVAEPTTYTIQVGIGRHIEPRNPGMAHRRPEWQFMNHSCEPSVAVDVMNRVFVACRDIAAGEEITFDYTTTEWEMATPFDCVCGAAGCLGHVAGFSRLSPAGQEARLPHAAPHIQMLRALTVQRTAAERS